MKRFIPAIQWQSRAVLMRHLRVHVRNWHTMLVPPIFEPLILLLAFGVGLGRQIDGFVWQGFELSYLHYLAPGMLAYTAFMIAFFQALFGAFVRMHFQKSWEGQLTTMVRLEHVVWGEALWAATYATGYAVVLGVVLGAFGLFGYLDLEWQWLPAVVPLLFLSALAFASVGLFFTAVVPTIDHMSLPFFLVIMPIAFSSSTYFPLPDVVVLREIVLLNPLHHLSEGLRWLLVAGKFTWHLPAAAVLCVVVIFLFVPLDQRLLRKRIFGER
ncbi:MAG: ABC transporter permease [Phycisphaeraceae bacterium]